MTTSADMTPHDRPSSFKWKSLAKMLTTGLRGCCSQRLRLNQALPCVSPTVARHSGRDGFYLPMVLRVSTGHAGPHLHWESLKEWLPV